MLIKKKNYVMKRSLGLFASYKAEMFKYKRTMAFMLTFLAPLVIAALITLVYFFRAEKMLTTDVGSMQRVLGDGVGLAAGFFYTFYLILLTVLIHQVEHKARALKDLFSYPVSYFQTYTAKWLSAFTLIVVTLGLYVFFSVIGIGFIELRYPELMSFDWAVLGEFVKQVAIIGLASMFLLGIQFVIAMRWSNVILAFGLGIVGFISAIVVMQGWEYAHWHPYALGNMAYHALGGKSQIDISHFIYYSMAGLLVTYLGGYYMWFKRRIV